MTGRPSNPSFSFAASGAAYGTSGMPCGMTSIFRAGTSYTATSSSFAFSAMTTTFDEMPTISASTLRCMRLRVGKHRMQRRHDRHVQPRQQRQDVRTGVAAKDAELVLQRYDIEVARIEDVSGVRVVLQLLVIDLDSHDWWILVGSARRRSSRR